MKNSRQNPTEDNNNITGSAESLSSKEEQIIALQKLQEKHQERWKYITQEDKKKIYEALSSKLQEKLGRPEIEGSNKDKSRKVWRDLCRVQLETLLLEKEENNYLSNKHLIDEKIENAHIMQVDLQEEALIEGVVSRLPHYTDHTKIDALAHRTGSLAYKAQLSRSPLAHCIVANADTKPGDLINYSVYDPEKIPPQLLDFAATGKREQEYNLIQQKKLAARCSEHMQSVFKPMLTQSYPLKFEKKSSTSEDTILETTQRIVQIHHTFEGQKPIVAYLISEHTPQINRDKKLRKRKTVDIRYTLLHSFEEIEYYLKGQITASIKKMDQRSKLLDMIPSRDNFMNYSQVRKDTKKILKQRDKHHGYTETDLDIHDKINTLLKKDLLKGAQRTSIQAIIDRLKKSKKDRMIMIDHLSNHYSVIKKVVEQKKG